MAAACSDEPQPAAVSAPPDIVASNAFYYYEDVEVAWRFYAQSLGFETVVDYGFAKILRLAESSYLTLVQASEGMHTADEPKTVTLYLVTDDLIRWHERLFASDTPIRVPLVGADGETGNSFVADDPNGYALKFVRYDPQSDHESVVAGLADVEPLAIAMSEESGGLSIRATAHAVYFDSFAGIPNFYESMFGTVPEARFDGQAAWRLSDSGYVVLVNGADELHTPSEKNGVTLSFLTTDVDAWFARAVATEGFELRTPEVLNEGGRVRVFVGYDPAGTFLEWDTFLDVPENRMLLDNL